MSSDSAIRDHQAWLGYLQPDGLVVSPAALSDAQVLLDRGTLSQLQQDFLPFAAEVELNEETIFAITDFTSFVREFLEWPDECLFGVDAARPLPDSLTVPRSRRRCAQARPSRRRLCHRRVLLRRQGPRTAGTSKPAARRLHSAGFRCGCLPEDGYRHRRASQRSIPRSPVSLGDRVSRIDALSLAENFLNQAKNLAPDDPLVDNERAYLLFRQAIENPAGINAPNLVQEATASLQDLIARRGALDEYPYHVLGSQGLSWARRGNPGRQERAGYLRALVRHLEDACKQHPRSKDLKQLYQDVQRELLGLATSPANRTSSK